MSDVKTSGFIALFMGVALLLFTFASAYQFLLGVLDIPGSEDLMNLFGEVLAPLIMYAIRALYLGIMGWIGSILTRRGVQIMTAIPEETKPEETKPEKKTKAKEPRQTKQAKQPEQTEQTKQPELPERPEQAEQTGQPEQTESVENQK